MNKVTLTDSEWKIMELLWQNAPLTMRNIEDALKETTGWTKHTIISFLKRMITKGAVSVDESQAVKLYYPILDEEVTLKQETKSMLGKLYAGSLSLMVSTLVEQEEISEKEVDELMDILRKGKEGLK